MGKTQLELDLMWAALRLPASLKERIEFKAKGQRVHILFDGAVQLVNYTVRSDRFALWTFYVMRYNRAWRMPMEEAITKMSTICPITNEIARYKLEGIS